MYVKKGTSSSKISNCDPQSWLCVSCRNLEFAGLTSHSQGSQHTDPIPCSLQHSQHQVTFPVVPEFVPRSSLASWRCSEHILGFLAKPQPPPKQGPSACLASLQCCQELCTVSCIKCLKPKSVIQVCFSRACSSL